MDRMALTKRQKEVLDFVARFVQENGYSPSYEEIARGLNLASLATVHKHIAALDTKNYLKRGFNRSHGCGPADCQRHHRFGKQCRVLQRQNWNLKRLAVALGWRQWCFRLGCFFFSH